MMPETDAESRLRRYLAAYERLCKKYGLVILDDMVCERFYSDGSDSLPANLQPLQKNGIHI